MSDKPIAPGAAQVCYDERQGQQRMSRHTVILVETRRTRSHRGAVVARQATHKRLNEQQDEHRQSELSVP